MAEAPFPPDPRQTAHPGGRATDPKGMPVWGAAAAIGALGVAGLVALQGEPGAQNQAPNPPSAVTAPLQSNAGASAVQTPGAPANASPITPAPQAGSAPKPDAGKSGGPPVAIAGIDDDGVSNPNLEFIVRFRSGPLSEAQALFAAGDASGAEAAARRAIEARANLRGLCFARFTLGGAEIVLAHCARVPDTQKKTVSQRWDRRLNAMSDVDYADPNLEVKNDNPVRPPR
jgi:hypothetical protein